MALKEQTPIQKALAELWRVGSSQATPEQIADVAKKFGVEVWKLEGFYFDEVERSADE